MKAQSLASAAGAGVMLAAGVTAEATFKVSSLCSSGLLYPHYLCTFLEYRSSRRTFAMPYPSIIHLLCAFLRLCVLVLTPLAIIAKPTFLGTVPVADSPISLDCLTSYQADSRRG